jgi:hypothetical protein
MRTWTATATVILHVEVHSADTSGLALTATGPVEFDVQYVLSRPTREAALAV